MRVLLATDAWEPQINGVVRTLQKVKALSPANGVELRMVTPDQFHSVPMPGYSEIRLALANARKLKRIVEEFRPDVAHVATEGPIGLAARNAVMAMGVPLTTGYHTRFPEYLRARAPVPVSLSYAMLRRFHRASAGIFVSTQSLEDELRARGFRNLMRWSFGVDLSIFRPRAQSTTTSPRPVFLYVGRVSVEKNLEAFLSLDLPGAKMIVGDGPDREALMAKFPDAIFPGAKTGQELADLYAQADVFVFPSRTDTFGVVILEALASGLPVAAFPVMGPRDIIGGTKAGVLSEDLRAAALECLTLDRSAPPELAASYSWEASIRQFCGNLEAARAIHARERMAAA